MQPKTQLGYILRDLFSGKDGYTLDMTKLLWALSVLVFLIMSVVSVFLEIEFRFTEWAIALGTVLASGAGAIRLKGIMDADKTLQKKEDE